MLRAGTISALLALLAACTCFSQVRIEMIPVVDSARHETVAQLETRIFMPMGDGPFPVAILNHGSAGGAPKQSLAWQREGKYLSERGYIVVAPMRRGRGKSTGVSLESEEKNCATESWIPGLTSAMEDVDAIIEFSRTLPKVKPHEVLLLGVSRGGFLSIAYSAEGKYRNDVQRVVNLVGGWVAQAEDKCPVDFNLLSFRKYGPATQTKMLWLYGVNDMFYGDANVNGYFEAFKSAGGSADFYLIDGVPENGHWLPNYSNKWRPYVERFLFPHLAP